jgi:hypothetical protein
MNNNTLRAGYLSSWGNIILTILLIGGFFLQMVIVPDRGWIDCKTSYYTIDTSRSFLSDFCGFAYFLQTPLILVLFACFNDYSQPSQKIYSGIALSLIIIFTAFCTLSYIVELTIRNINFTACEDDCYLYYAHTMFQKSICSVNAMANAVFLGSAELIIIPVFSKSNKTGKNIRHAMLMAGIFNLAGAIIYVLGISGIFTFCMIFSYIFFNASLIMLIRFFNQSKQQENKA